MDKTILRKLIDPGLRDLHDEANSQAARLQSGAVRLAQTERRLPVRIEVLVTFRGSFVDLVVAGLESASAVLASDATYVAEGSIDPMRIGELAAIPHVITVRLQPELVPTLKKSVVTTQTYALRAVSPELNGQGVVIGIIDSGIDWRHGAFTKLETKPDGSTREVSRILAIWDQTLTATAGEKEGPGGVGVVYTQEDITHALSHPRRVRERDDETKHGTHVAGIAAGDGSPASCCTSGGTYVGIAPQADLVIVRLDFKGSNFYRFGRALEFMLTRAAGKPVVVNISLGFFLSAGRDGTHPFERVIDKFVAGGPGRAVVVATGNFAHERRHVKVTVPKSGSAEVRFHVDVGDVNRRGFDLWYPNGHQLNLQIITPEGSGSKEIPHGDGAHSFYLSNVNRVPPAPTQLTAKPGNGQVELNWKASFEATSYEVLRDPGCTGVFTTIARPKTTIYTDTNVTNGQSYCYVVRAINETRTSPASPPRVSPDSNRVSESPNSALPVAPTALTATPGIAQVVLNWSVSASATSYEILRDKQSSGNFSLIATVTGTTYIDTTDLINGASYGYVVRAKNAAGTSPSSSKVYAEPTPPLPAAPADVIAAVGHEEVVLNWNASTNADSYEVLHDEGCTGNFTLIETLPKTTYIDRGLTNGKSYCYIVRAKNATGLSPDSPNVSATPVSSRPAAPTNISARPGDKIVYLQWEPTAGADAYELERDDGCTGAFKTLVTINALNEPYYEDMNGLINGTSYCYRVKAKNEIGWGPDSSPAIATPSVPLPSIPLNFTATPGNTLVELNWDASVWATSYEVLQDEGCTGTFTTIATPASMTHTVRGLTNGKSYCYVVRAKNAAGQPSPDSLKASAIPSATPSAPPVPTQLKGTPGNAQVSLSWQASSVATHYVVERASEPGGPYSPVNNPNPTVASCLDNTGLLNGRTYYYVVSAINAGVPSGRSAELSVIPLVGDEVRAFVQMNANHADNNDHNYSVVLNSGTVKLFPGEWALKLINPSTTTDVEAHCWILHYDVEGQSVTPPTFLVPGAEMTLSVPSTAQGAISVANYIEPGRKVQPRDGAPGGIHNTSGRGPVRKNAAANPKPDLAAPGTNITSAQANVETLPGEGCGCLPDGFCSLYMEMTGTSQAAPHVTGAIALMLQVDPTLTKEEIARFLRDAAKLPTGANRSEWGAGLLDVKSAVELVKLAKLGVKVASPNVLDSAPVAHTAAMSAGIQGVIPMPPNSFVDALRARARAIPDGELCAAIISRHFSEVRRLINTNTRVATMWHRGDGPMLLRRFIIGAVDEEAASPLLNPEQREYLERLFEQLKRYGSPSLRASIDSYGSKVIQILERPLAVQVASQSAQVHA